MSTNSAPLAKSHFKIKTACRVCGGESHTPVLDLGEQAIGNAFREPGAPEPLKAPLELVRCTDCSFVQLQHSVDCDLMYASYWYRSGTNRTMSRHLAGIAAQASALAPLKPGEVVIDIGCNDGTTLAAYGVDVHKIGVDPSNIAPASCDAHINDYFSFAAVEAALGGRLAKVITSIAMFYDLDEPRAFVEDVRRCLDVDGIWILELSYLPAMLEAVSYDTVCHEHVGYYSIRTFERVLDGIDLEPFDVEFNDSNGGSFRLMVAPRGSRVPTRRFIAARNAEAELQLDTDAPFELFRSRVEASRRQLREFLDQARAEGQQVWGYGASTKGMVTLQHCGVTARDLTAIAERNPDKYGLLAPGCDVPIRAEAEMRDSRPDYLLVLPWHFMTEFVEREAEYLAAGGKLVAPLPEFRIIGS